MHRQRGRSSSVLANRVDHVDVLAHERAKHPASISFRMTAARRGEGEMKATEPNELDVLFRAVGLAISDWAFVEEGLFNIFEAILGGEAIGPPSCAFIAADNMRAKIGMVDSMVRHSGLDP